jgi:hypothetical protein
MKAISAAIGDQRQHDDPKFRRALARMLSTENNGQENRIPDHPATSR